MRIIYWTPFFLPETGGIETFSANLLPRLQKLNYDIVVVTSHGSYDLPDETEFNGIPVFRFSTRKALGKPDLKLMMKIRQRIAELKQSFKPDIVHIHISDPSVYFHLNTNTSRHTPTLLTFHREITGYNLKYAADTLLWRALSIADWVSAVSEATLYSVRQFMPNIKDRSTVIYNGIDIPDLIPQPLPFDQPCILCLGRLVHEKGFDLIIKAFAELRASFPKAHLKIAGDGPKRSELRQLSASLGLGEAVEFTGKVDPDKVTALINQSTVVVMPSRSEGFPMVGLEAARMERPVVAASAGGLQELISHGQTGLLIDRENSRAIAKAVAFLLDHPGVAIRMGKAARSRALDVYSLNNTVDSYHKLYCKLVDETVYARVTGEQ